MGLWINLFHKTDRNPWHFLLYVLFLLNNSLVIYQEKPNCIHFQNFLRDCILGLHSHQQPYERIHGVFSSSFTWSQERREILLVIQCNSLHTGSLRISAKTEAKGTWRKTTVALKCDVSVEKREAENLRGKRSGTTIFAFYISSVINTKLYKVLMGHFQRELSKENRIGDFKTYKQNNSNKMRTIF